MATPARIVFAGTPAFAVPTLGKLIELGHAPVAVLTQPDRPVGRGRVLSAGPVKQLAVAAGIPVLQPASLKDAGIQAELQSIAPDLVIVVAYGLLLPPAVLAIPARPCVNVHASLLPRWRGASPVQAAILAGDSQTGVCIMALEAGLDTGPVYARATLEIRPAETAGELEARLARLGADTLADILEDLLAGKLVPAAQARDGITYARRISKSDGHIDWRLPAPHIARQIRAYNPWPVAETTLDGRQLRCHAGLAIDAPAAGLPGQVITCSAEGVDVQTGEGTLRLTAVQLPGKSRVSAADFARGRQLAGKVLGR